MAQWKTYRISDVMMEIDEEKFVLPVIQRELVWNEEKMESLFDTVLKGDSFGGIIAIKEESGSIPLFNYRPFTKDGNFIPSQNVVELNQTQHFVIDGQQRLQSFYIGLKGSINGKSLYFDLFSDYLTEFEFKFEKDKNTLPQTPRDNQERPISTHFWYSVKALFNRLKETNDEDQVADEIIDRKNITDNKARTY